jgi:hypothetical protein
LTNYWLARRFLEFIGRLFEFEKGDDRTIYSDHEFCARKFQGFDLTQKLAGAFAVDNAPPSDDWTGIEGTHLPSILCPFASEYQATALNAAAGARY